MITVSMRANDPRSRHRREISFIPRFRVAHALEQRRQNRIVKPRSRERCFSTINLNSIAPLCLFLLLEINTKVSVVKYIGLL